MMVVGAESAPPGRCMITGDAYGAQSRNLNRKKRRGVILIQIHLKRLEMEKKRSGKDLCQGRLMIAVSPATDHVFGICESPLISELHLTENSFKPEL